MPRYVDMYLSGKLKLDEMISREITLDQINEAFQALLGGEVARQIIRFER
jgi:S-(hydroxymethyl)glutathione dehydrogenase/alcohol dehydrogenase